MTAPGRLDRVRETPLRFTAEEFMALATRPPLADVPGKLELVDGRIVRMSPAHALHWMAQQRINQDLAAAFRDMPDSWWVGPEASVRLSARKIRLPDVAVLRDPKPTRAAFPSDLLFLAVEISDTTLRVDLGPKRRDYALAGVPHYWVVDLVGREVHVMADPSGAEYVSTGAIPFGQSIAVPGTGAAITIG